MIFVVYTRSKKSYSGNKSLPFSRLVGNLSTPYQEDCGHKYEITGTVINYGHSVNNGVCDQYAICLCGMMKR